MFIGNQDKNQLIDERLALFQHPKKPT